MSPGLSKYSNNTLGERSASADRAEGKKKVLMGVKLAAL